MTAINCGSAEIPVERQKLYTLFDSTYYRNRYPDIPTTVDPLAHFLAHSAEEGRCPHPLFDTLYYLRKNLEVAESGMNPLVHYVFHGAWELRNPHPLFDAAFYVAEHAEVRFEAANPLTHFLKHGTRAGFNPNPLFDVEFYLAENPDVAASGVNPLIHYIERGAAEGRDPHPLFGTRYYLERHPDVARAGLNPLAHYLEHGDRERRDFSRPLHFGESQSARPLGTAKIQREIHIDKPIPVFCVYGDSNVLFIRDLVIPAFAFRSRSLPLELHFLNYRSNERLIEPSQRNGFTVRDWSDSRPPGHLGFGEAVNYLFSATKPSECFLICNPDAFPMGNCLERLVNTYVREKPAIVEARQWPSPHPKEFNPETLETPWASGAFNLISAEAFRELEGFDPIYFLYLEDVDFSWRAWLRGFRVIHEPSALCAHATGLHFYSANRFYPEYFFSLRNFLVISYKFFGVNGEKAALAYLNIARLPKPLHKKIVESYSSLRPSIQLHPEGKENIEKVKILGLNLFHELRQ